MRARATRLDPQTPRPTTTGGRKINLKSIPVLLVLPVLMLVLASCAGGSQLLPGATPTATQVPPAAAPIPAPTATQVLPAATPIPTPTATQVPPAAAPIPTPTATQVPPAATPIPTPTSTQVPPAATSTPIPTATSTPTATPTQAHPTPTPTLLPASLSFVPDPGIRIDFASLAKAKVGENGLVYLFYNDTSGKRLKSPIASSYEGLIFTEGETSDGTVLHPYAVDLPDGTWRQYVLTKDNMITSKFSLDGKVFTQDEGIRYSPSEEDMGTLGTYDIFVDTDGGVVLLYVGDLRGLNNVRRAYSPPGDNGWAFSYERGNVLGDDQAGGGSRTYVDIKSVSLPDGRRRLFAMRGGTQILSFISDTELRSFSLEPGVRLSKSDFTALEVISLHDPMVIKIPDDRYRMYLHLHITDATGAERTTIVSATTPPS